MNSQSKDWEFFCAVLLPLSLMYFLYNILISIVSVFLQVIALFNKKIKLFVDGRTTVFDELKTSITDLDKTIWMHCASLGEFEQGRPIIEKLKNNYSKHKIVLTFFSPSGFEVQKKYKGVDVVCYLPLDSKENAKRFIELVHPEIAIFVKYEFWPNFLRQLNNRNIKTLLVAGIFRKEQLFFKPYGSWMRKPLKAFSHFFVQDENSKTMLETIGFQNTSISGDTRFDRVAQITNQENSLPFMDTFKGTDLLIIAGSTWKPDTTLLTHFMNTNEIPNIKLVIAPHNIATKEIEILRNQLNKKVALYSERNDSDLKEATIFIVDTIGILTKIYSYADVAYVGGGFETGLHNILEPATFAVPVIIGPQFDKFKEARELVDIKGCLVVTNQTELNEQLTSLLTNSDFRNTTGNICKNYVEENKGATATVMHYIDTIIEL